MKRAISRMLLKLAGWRAASVEGVEMPKCVICVAPHTSNWDFVIGKLFYTSIGLTAGFLMKKSWFFFPFKMVVKNPVSFTNCKETGLLHCIKPCGTTLLAVLGTTTHGGQTTTSRCIGRAPSALLAEALGTAAQRPVYRFFRHRLAPTGGSLYGMGSGFFLFCAFSLCWEEL